MSELTIAWMLGCVCGFFMGVTVAFAELLLSPPRARDPDWRHIQSRFQGDPTNPPPRNP